jgi:outer membrane protein TolC
MFKLVQLTAVIAGFTLVVSTTGVYGADSSLQVTENKKQENQQLAAESEQEKEYREFKTKLLKRYASMVEKIDRAERSYVSVFAAEKSAVQSQSSSSVPRTFSPWWSDAVKERINPSQTGLGEDIASLFAKTLRHSSQVKVFTDLPLIRQSTIQEAEGPFDYNLFMDGRWADLDEPVGDDLKTGGPSRYKEQSKSFEYGLKKKFLTGTEVELKQRVGDMNTNSIYFDPEDQARAGTYLTFRQPLLKGFGISYQETVLNLSRIDYSIAGDELQRQVESHLLEVVRSYWGLYLERTLFLQKLRLAEKTQDILKQMQGRSEVDVSPSLLARARSQAGIHELGAIRAEYAMRNAQSRIRALVNDPSFLSDNGVEMITNQVPVMQRPEGDFDNVLQIALLNRPEIAQGIKQIQATALREAKTDHELMPSLDFVFDTYIKGLEGDYAYDEAYSEQFNEGRPSYMFGLRFEYPLGNNGAKARNLRSRIEMRQMLHQLDVTVENVLLEAQISYREMDKYYDSMIQSYQIMNSDKEEIQELMARIDYLLAQDEPYGDMLYRLMDASERLTDSEEVFAKSELTYNLAIYNLYRAMGILVSNSDVVFIREKDEEELPVLNSTIQKSENADNRMMK